MKKLKKHYGIMKVAKDSKLLLINFLFLISCNGCKDSSARLHSKSMIYSSYDESDSLKMTKKYEATIFSLNDNIDSNVIKNDSIYCSFKQVVDSSGIYRFCKGKKIKTHSFVNNLITEYCLTSPPFLNQNVSYRGNKVFSISNKEFTIYHFIENTGNHTVFDSYYLKDVGFICYYSFSEDDYIICDSLSGYHVNSKEIRQLGKALVKDTSFFSRYILRKLYPNFNRSGIKE